MTKNITNDVPDTSDEYQDCLGVKEEKGRPASLASFLGVSDVPETEDEAWKEHNYQNWREHWKGMPSYESQNLEAARKIVVNFRNEEDVKKFGELIKQSLTDKTRSIWYPEKERDENSLKRWMDENDA